MDERLSAVVADLTNVEVNIERYKLKHKMTDIEYDVQFYADQMKELQMKIIELEAQMRLVDLLDAYVKDPQNRYNLVLLYWPLVKVRILLNRFHHIMKRC